jgi:hypothetical protein
MAHPEVSGRKMPRRPGKSISEFCREWNIGRATFYLWRRQGLAPAVMQPAGPGGRAFITPESEEAWKRAHTALAAVIDAE